MKVRTKPKEYKIELLETFSEHWYKVGKIVVPSSTTILSYYPKSEELTKWIAGQGYEESQKIKRDAAERGTRVHEGIDNLIGGAELLKDHYTLEEWYALSTFQDWWNETTPEVIYTEKKLYSKRYKYAGTVDFVGRIGGRVVLLDWKTSKNVYNYYPLQVASYAQALKEMENIDVELTGVTLFGYRRNKKGYKDVYYENWKEHMKAFKAMQQIFYYERGKGAPEPLNLPGTIKL